MRLSRYALFDVATVLSNQALLRLGGPEAVSISAGWNKTLTNLPNKSISPFILLFRRIFVSLFLFRQMLICSLSVFPMIRADCAAQLIASIFVLLKGRPQDKRWIASNMFVLPWLL